MMSSKLTLLRKFLFLASFGLLLCEPLPSYGAEAALHAVPAVSGNVKLLRGKLKPQPLKVGMSLRSTDKLVLAKGSSVRVRCQNRSRWQPKAPGTFSVATGCKVPEKVQISTSSRIDTRSGADDPTRPYLISPRETKIVGFQPLLRWNPVVGISRYQVEVSGPGVAWTAEVSQPEVRYGGKETFQPGMRYRVRVKGTEEKIFSNEVITGFSLLDATTVKQVKDEIEALQREQLSSEAEVLELAYLEQSYELYSAAIDRLNQWVAQGNQSAAVEKLLGDLYWQVELPRLARRHYSTAQKLMNQDKNRLGEAEVLSQLGEIDRGLGQLKEAIAWLEAAKPVYQALEDGEQVQAIEVRLADLRERV
jgi:hypothetical protein